MNASSLEQAIHAELDKLRNKIQAFRTIEYLERELQKARNSLEGAASQDHAVEQTKDMVSAIIADHNAAVSAEVTP